MYADFFAELRDFVIESKVASPTEIRGCTSSEIVALQARLSSPLPKALHECLLQFGTQSGDVMDGDLFGVAGINEAYEVAEEIATDELRSELSLGRLLPILQHHGYQFHYLPADRSDDPGVWLFREGNQQPVKCSPSLTAWFREIAINAVEQRPWNDEICREIASHRENWTSRKQVIDTYQREAARLRQDLLERQNDLDQLRGKISGPLEFQRIWNAEVRSTQLFNDLIGENKRIPWGWTHPRDA